MGKVKYQVNAKLLLRNYGTAHMQRIHEAARMTAFQRQLPTARDPHSPCGQATPTVLSPPQATGVPTRSLQWAFCSQRCNWHRTSIAKS
jgi:hypothetical protein